MEDPAPEQVEAQGRQTQWEAYAGAELLVGPVERGAHARAGLLAGPETPQETHHKGNYFNFSRKPIFPEHIGPLKHQDMD